MRRGCICWLPRRGRAGEAYNASGGTNVTMKELQGAIAETLGRACVGPLQGGCVGQDAAFPR